MQSESFHFFLTAKAANLNLRTGSTAQDIYPSVSPHKLCGLEQNIQSASVLWGASRMTRNRNKTEIFKCFPLDIALN
jgi:predicted 2-oxoglutarate/Fe(II)-dependent dioxygenase YbiX